MSDLDRAQWALELLAPLVAATNGWDEPRIEVFVRGIAALSDDQSIVDTVRTLTDTWDAPAAPTWGAFTGIYREKARQRRMAQPALPAAREDHVTLAQHVVRLRAMAARGDREAQAELDRWQEMPAKHPAWARALGLVTEETTQ